MKKNKLQEWDAVRNNIFTPDEIIESDIRVAIISEIIKARNDKKISQKKLEELSGVKQPIIARLETGKTNPRLDTLIKILKPLGKTIKIVSIEN